MCRFGARHVACFHCVPQQIRAQQRVHVYCKELAFGQYVQLVMDDSRRAGPGKAPAEEASADDRPAPGTASAPASEKPKRSVDVRFAGAAMKSLFESADVSIRRDDETRVLSRAQEAVAEIQQRHGLGPGLAPEPPRTQSSRPPSGRPGPRVDVWLWVVLVAGLFGIAGWMLLYGL